MNRRGFITAMAAAQVVAVSSESIAKPSNKGIRISVHKDDPGYKFYIAAGGPIRDWEIFVDGVEIDNVITADTREGYVFRYLNNRKGYNYIDHSTGDAASIELGGVVTINCIDRTTHEVIGCWS